MTWIVLVVILLLIPTTLTLALTGLGRIATPRLGRTIRVPGARLHVHEVGAGPPIVFIHGAGTQMRSLTEPLVPRLADRHRLIFLDRPDFGYSRADRGEDLSLVRQAQILLAGLDALEVNRPLLVGHSLGGALALQMAQQAPDRFSGLALIAPLTHPVDDLPEPFRPLVISNGGLRHALGWTIAAPGGLLQARRALTAIFDPEPIPEGYEPGAGGLLMAAPRQFVAASAEATRGMGDLAAQVAAYPSMRCPVAILFGRDDRILDPERQGRAAAQAIPGATLTLVEGGHMLPVTQPDLTARWIAERAAPDAT